MNDQLQNAVERFNRDNPDAPDIVMENVQLRAEVERHRARVAELTEEHEADQEERAMRREDRDQHLADRARGEAEIERLTAERDAARRDAEERRLELLAERGDAAGAPSADWTPRDGFWEHTSGAEVLIAPGQSYGLWQLWRPYGITGRLELASDDVLTARAAMRRLSEVAATP